jgi:hypothetical protein
MGRPGATRRRGGAGQGRTVGGGGGGGVQTGATDGEQGHAGEERRRERGNSPRARWTAATAHRDPP